MRNWTMFAIGVLCGYAAFFAQIDGKPLPEVAYQLLPKGMDKWGSSLWQSSAMLQKLQAQVLDVPKALKRALPQSPEQAPSRTEQLHHAPEKTPEQKSLDLLVEEALQQDPTAKPPEHK